MLDGPAERPEDSLSLTAGFAIGCCQSCDRTVLASRILRDEAVLEACVHCDEVLDPKELRWVSASELVELGYLVEGHEDDSSCDTGGGCRDGSCGIQQPSQQ